MKHFRSFRLDVVNHCLWNGEDRVPLTPKAFDVLRYLVEHADRLVTQDEILGALWPETYVNPEVIKKYVLGIRKALGDRREKTGFIETFPRRGYQFVAPVTEGNAAGSSDADVHAAQEIVGREASIAQLDGYLTHARQGQRQIVFITGEAGVGKTTLIDEFHQTAARRANLRVIRGQCVEGFGGKEAYYPVLEAIGQWARDAAAGSHVIHTLAKQAPTWLIQFPSLIKAEQREALQKEILGATRERMVREICEALESLTAQDPLVLLLEDLHWVDPSTLDFISALARRRGSAKLLLVGTYRPAEVIISQSPLRALKQDLVIHKLSQEIALERLAESDVTAYIAIKFADGNIPAGFAEVVYRHSGGNALFMVTILQDMLKKGLIVQADGRWTLTVALENVDLNVPETLDQLIEMQFQQLSPVEQRILRSASVAGERFSVWAITTAAEIDPGIEDVCEALAERLQFIQAAGVHELANGQISAHYDFRHSLYREVLYRRLSEATRSKLHLQLAQRLKAFCDSCDQELATELALHFEGGRDYKQAVHYLLLAAHNAVGRFAYRDCLEILHHARELVLKLTPAVRAEIEVRILEFMGDAHFALGALGQSAKAYTAAATQAQQAGLKAAQMHALTSAMYPLGFIDPEEGVAAVEEAVKISMSVNDPPRLALTQMLAAGFRMVFDSGSQTDAELCTSAYETLLRLYPSELDPYQRIVYAHILMVKGNYGEALDLCERSVSEAGASRVGQVVNFLAHFGALSAKTSVLLRTGQLGKVLQITKAERASPDENLSLFWLLSFCEAWLRTLAFDFEGARRICQASCNAAREYPDRQSYAIDQMAAGNMALHEGKYSQAREHFRHVQDLEVRTKFFMHWAWRMMAQLESSNAWLLSGNVVNACTAADGFLKSAQSSVDPYLQALAWDLKARVAMAQSNLQGARESIQRALAIVDNLETLVAAWQVYATAWQLHRSVKEHKVAEMNRERAETCVLKIANTFAADEPLRTSFLTAAPVRRILREKLMNTAARQKGLSRVAAP